MATLTTTDLDNGKIDLETHSTVVNSQTETTTVTRLGDTVRTLKGLQDEYEQAIATGESDFEQAIINSGYQVLGSFASGVTLTAVNQVLDYDGGLYRTTEVLPYTTDGATPDLDSGEWVVVSDGVLSGIARSLNVLDSEVIYSTDTVTILDDVLYIYNAINQAVWGKPSSVGVGETIVSVVGGVLTTSAETYELNTITQITSLNGAIHYKESNSASSIENMFSQSPVANAVGDICSANGALFIKTSDSLPITKDNYRVLNNPSIFAFGGKVDGVTDDTNAFIDMVNSGFEVVELGQGVMAIDELTATLANDLTIKGNQCEIKNTSSSSVQAAAYFTVSGYNLRIDDVTFDADNLAFQCLRIQNESNVDIKDVELNNIKAFNAYRSSQDFTGGDGILVRGGFRRVIINNPEVNSVKMASGAGISGSEGVSGITVVQNFAETLMPRYVEINNPYVEDVYSEDDTYTDDQDGAKLFGIDTEFMEQGSCRVNGGTFKNCWGRSLKFQRPDGVVNGTTFIRDEGLASGGGNSEIDFQRGGGVVRNITCKYTDFNPTTIVNSYQNQYETHQFLVDGVSVSLENTVLPQVVQRFSQLTADVATPINIDNIKVIGEITRVLRYLTQNDSASDPLEYANIRNITVGQCNYLAQVYGNNTGQRVDVYASNCATSGTSLGVIDEGTFSNAVTVRLNSDNLVGFGINNDSFYTPTVASAAGTVTINSSEERLDYTRTGRLVRVAGQLRVSAVVAPSGTLSITLPLNNDVGTQTSNWNLQPIHVTETFSGSANAYAIQLTDSSNLAYIVDASGNSLDSAIANQIQAGTRLYINFTYKTSE